MRRSQQSMEISAQAIAGSVVEKPAMPTPGRDRTGDLTGHLVEVNYQSTVYQVNAKVAAAVTETLGTLLDELA